MTLTLSGRLVLVGAGKMGGAMLEGWLDQGLPGSSIAILDPGPPPEITDLISKHGIAHNPPLDTVDDAEVVLLAVKPQIMDDVLPTILPLGGSNPVFLSIAAGRTIAASRRIWGPARRSSAPCRTRRPPSAAASP